MQSVDTIRLTKCDADMQVRRCVFDEADEIVVVFVKVVVQCQVFAVTCCVCAMTPAIQTQIAYR